MQYAALKHVTLPRLFCAEFDAGTPETAPFRQQSSNDGNSLNSSKQDGRGMTSDLPAGQQLFSLDRTETRKNPHPKAFSRGKTTPWCSFGSSLLCHLTPRVRDARQVSSATSMPPPEHKTN